jgi:DNA-binding transcriptional regulator GbsR (MarR family)
MKSSTYSLFAATTLALSLLGCQEEGPTEKAGRAVDETIEKIKHGNEGTFEKSGRKLDEAIKDTKEKIEQSKKD